MKKNYKILSSSEEELVIDIAELNREDYIVIDKDSNSFISGIVLDVYPEENKFSIQPIVYNAEDFQTLYPNVFEEMEIRQEKDTDSALTATFNFDDVNSVHRVDENSRYIQGFSGFTSSSMKSKITKSEYLRRVDSWLNNAENNNETISLMCSRMIVASPYWDKKNNLDFDLLAFLSERLQELSGDSINKAGELVDNMLLSYNVFDSKEEAIKEGCTSDEIESLGDDGRVIVVY